MTKETGDECKCIKVRIGNPSVASRLDKGVWDRFGIRAEDIKKRIAEIEKQMMDDRSKLKFARLGIIPSAEIEKQMMDDRSDDRD